MALANETYIQLETYKRDGLPVATPVWVGRLDGDLVILTNRNSFKVRRLDRDKRVRVTACNSTGKKTHGPTLEGEGAVLMDSAYLERVAGVLSAKYGLLFKFFSAVTWLSGKSRQQCALRLKVNG